MSGLVSKLLSGPLASLSGSHGGHTPAHQFVARPSPHYSEHLVIHPAGYAVEAPPLYTIIVNTASKPNILVYHGDPAPVNCVADATISSLSSKIQCNLRGQPFLLRVSTLSDKFTVESPAYGRLKWKTNDFSSALTLLNQAGSRIAEYKSDRAQGGKILSIYEPCDARFVELLALTAIAAKTSGQIESEIGTEVISAIAGV
ncbi:hypothetical protein S7711_09009 [Stachybotrys chartarum IBT 7711]|uniref:Uncharacterized protein n=1 Tax=Stachybotrys chartarum (strain CBS 109288 / IBT 7711) TaxID=1280523 RepID=A0A084AX80_STACB|nr:hypothetical protein S7711_09009 [Stachybotrys chartarum IBT 7711]